MIWLLAGTLACFALAAPGLIRWLRVRREVLGKLDAMDPEERERVVRGWLLGSVRRRLKG